MPEPNTFFDRLEALLKNLMVMHISIPGISHRRRIDLREKMNQCVDQILPLLEAEIDKNGYLLREKYLNVIKEEVPRILEAAAEWATHLARERKDIDDHRRKFTDAEESPALTRQKSTLTETDASKEPEITAEDVINAFDNIYGHAAMPDSIKVGTRAKTHFRD